MRKLLAVFLFTSFYGFGQTDFNNYTTILSKGEIPEDFTTLTFNKLKSDLELRDNKLSKQQQKVFFEGINYAIDDLLHSGYVTYGDELSIYIEEIVDRLLENDTKLRSKLRFYVLKSNSANAFSTEQGIVFVTTGLVSQVTSEAQLAFILAHEICHYTGHHVLESFSYRAKNRRRSIEQMSVYSKDKELEADREGLKLYKAAGYELDEVIPVFDMLLYSYLPFEEAAVTLDYIIPFDSLYVPSKILPQERFEIKADEDEDDSKSSHPNISKRKEAIQTAMDELSDWGNEVYLLGQERFLMVRNIARFESVRSDIIAAKYADALYSIFLLETEFENSLYLKRMKAQSWLGILMYLLDHKLSRTIDEKTDYEGESAAMHYLISELSKDELEAMCLRQTFDIYTENSSDEEIQLIWDKAVKTIIWGENFKLDQFYPSNLYEAKALNFKDYSRDFEVIGDTLKFHQYLIPDVIRSKTFQAAYKKHKTDFEAFKSEQAAYNRLTYRQQRKIDIQEYNDRLKLGIDDLIVIEPTVYRYRQNQMDRVNSEKLEIELSSTIQEVSTSLGITIHPINSARIQEEGTAIYNERSILFNMVLQFSQNADIDPFPVDFQLLRGIEKKYGTSKVMISMLTYRYQSNLEFRHLLFSILLPPTVPVFLPKILMSGNKTEIALIVMDTKKANVISGTSEYFKDKPRKHIVGAHIYSIFDQLKTTK